MQAILFARDAGSRVSDYPGAEGLLESADDVVIEQQGRVVAKVLGLKNEIGNSTFQQRPGLFYCFEDPHWLSLRLYAGERLIWSHAGAMCVLQGMPMPMVLGPSWVVLSGKPTRPGDPLPGLHEPILADVFDNPAQRSHEEIFRVVRESLGLGLR